MRISIVIWGFMPFMVSAQLNEQKWRELDEEIRYSPWEGTGEAISIDLPPYTPNQPDFQENTPLFDEQDDWKNIDRKGNRKLWREGETHEGWGEQQTGEETTEEKATAGEKIWQHALKRVIENEKEKDPDFEPPEWTKPDEEQKEEDEEKKPVEAPSWVVVLAWILGAALLGALLFYVLKRSLNRNPRIQPGNYHEEINPQEIPLPELERALQAHIQQEEYRLAVRVLYLHTLKLLVEKDYIAWHSNKTNSIYIMELAGTPYQKGFRQLSRTYEYVWYGERNPTKSQYEAISAEFNVIIALLE